MLLKIARKCLHIILRFLKNGELSSGTKDDDLDKCIINGISRDRRGTDASNNAVIELAAGEEAKNEEDEDSGGEAAADWNPPG